jgi:hypothetical protein
MEHVMTNTEKLDDNSFSHKNNLSIHNHNHNVENKENENKHSNITINCHVYPSYHKELLENKTKNKKK